MMIKQMWANNVTKTRKFEKFCFLFKFLCLYLFAKAAVFCANG